MEEKRKIWCRLGAWISGTKEEMDALLKDGNIGNIIERGDFELEGDGYIPEYCVESYNDMYGEQHEICDVDF